MLTCSKQEEAKEKPSNRKPTRTQSSQSNSSGRQYSSANRRTSTTETPSRKRTSSLKFKSRSSTRASQNDEDNEDILDDEEEEDRNFVRASEKPTRARLIKNRPRIQSAESRARRKQKNRDNKLAENSKVEETVNKLTTPEPPTTPDPGSGEFQLQIFHNQEKLCTKSSNCVNNSQISSAKTRVSFPIHEIVRNISGV